MAKAPKIDEQISYNGWFFIFAGLFGLVTFWAVWDEVITRREWKDEQNEFFKIERKLAHDRAAAARKALEADPKHQKAVSELKRLKDELNTQKKSAYEAAQAALKEADFDRFDRQQNVTFRKSELDETYYYYTLSKHEGDAKHLAEMTAKKTAVETKVAESEAALAKATAAYNEKKKAVEAFTAPISDLEKELENQRKDLAELDRLAKVADDKTSEIVQYNLEDVGRVDRCESCHLGTTRSGFETVKPEKFASHPMRRTLLGIHPPEKFGCTLCHDGQGRATTAFYSHAPDRNEDSHAHHVHFWEAPVLRKRGTFAGYGEDAVKANFVEGNCRKCHVDQIDLRSTLLCEVNEECPNGEGQPKLKCDVPTAAGFAPPASAKNPPRHCVNEDGRPELVDLAPQQTRGRKIIDEAGCFGCHPIEGYDLPKPAPDLRHVAAKVDPSWMVEWIRDPPGLRPNTRMPHFFPEDKAAENEYPPKAVPENRGDEDADALFEKEELFRWNRDRQAVAMVSFLLSQSTKYNLVKGKAAEGDPKRGEELVKSLGCLGCHPAEDGSVKHKNRASHFDHGPQFTDVGLKTSADWIFNWLKEPKSYAPETRMPSLRLSDVEAADIASYLAGKKQSPKQIRDHSREIKVVSLAKGDEKPKVYAAMTPDEKLVERGRWLVNYYGCYGCHYVNGFETKPGIGVALSAFGAKPVDTLDFGDYIADHKRHTWESWTYNKLKHPRVFRYDRVDTRMPQFSFTEQEVKDVLVVLRGMRGEERDPITGRLVPLPMHVLSAPDRMREKGRQKVRWYNCYGCHSVDGFTGDIRQRYPGDLASLAPPILNNQGARTQPAWLFDFFKDVKSLRPWLSVRMPTFGFSDDNATTLVAMFSALDKAEFPYRFYSDLKLDGPRRQVAQTVFDEFKCQSCHVLGDVKICGSPPEPDCIKLEDAAQKAPNLLMSKQRLRGEWIVKWLENPEALMPGTRMPSFFPEGMNQLDAMLNLPETRARFSHLPPELVESMRKDPLLQRQMLSDLLMTMHAAPTAAVPKAKVKAKPKKRAASETRSPM